ncbi:5'-methylthioadenosine/S-adenosylhomocysteine nucleosidase [Pullulanibacillus sp. KACC 23026]|uniref:5'-methylthioadenosine/S-adenosylhomocysteine nucleosidase n=1 Tax=Pullulanibacillus sp. KACC 23026 TaxID=3028315 RepID=UPI0023B10EEC|nr:5'-methylthioadenosine/S-adenosylhomocysteine nucleosidase [Pullulanibacillus sp. KACC 23026]WEG14913.1 5'-methylthioadenosine/S-adenosylhomocysteine nucleosidase [Pullulanibacillus sp. KACC 23026]
MRIGIIGAMEEEVQLLKNKMDKLITTTLAGCHFFEGVVDGKEVVLLQSGIGKVNAAMGAALLIQQFSPNYIINTGSAGGFDHKLKVGDVVISSEVRHHDVDVTAFNYEYGQVPGLPAAFLPDSRLVEAAEKAARSSQEDIQVVKGLIATGDSFMSDPERVEAVRAHFHDLQAVEMEAAAIAQVCHQFQVPFVIIRALSDIAGKESHISFDQFLETAAKHSAEHILLMLKELD